MDCAEVDEGVFDREQKVVGHLDLGPWAVEPADERD